MHREWKAKLSPAEREKFEHLTRLAIHSWDTAPTRAGLAFNPRQSYRKVLVVAIQQAAGL